MIESATNFLWFGGKIAVLVAVCVGALLLLFVAVHFMIECENAIARWFDKGIVSDFVTQKLDEIFGNRRE